MARPRIRNSNSLLIFSTNITLGWSVTQRTSYIAGEAKTERGEWRRVVDDHGELVGYQPVVHEVRPVPSSDRSRCALQVPEMRANAGLMGRSRTARLSEEQRTIRLHPKSGRLMPEEDFVERVAKLMAIYLASANFHDMRKRGISDRAGRVYPKAPVKFGAPVKQGGTSC
jgi:hypothetical protein